MNMFPTFSFIIPHKNSPFLNRLLDSIPVRDDIQIIVVDDNSDIEKKPEILRPDVELILLDVTQSKGAGRARNVGLDMAKGKWLLFPDADDYYTDELSLLLDKYAKDEVTDIVYFNALKIDDYDNIEPYRCSYFINNYLSGKKGAEADLRYGYWEVWNRMVKRQLVTMNEISFEETPTGNDFMFSLSCSYYAQTIRVERDYFYVYYKWFSVIKRIRQDIRDELLHNQCKRIRFYKNVGYRSNKNLLHVTLSLVWKRKMKIGQAISCYMSFLNFYNLSWMEDVTNFFCQVLAKLYIISIQRVASLCH